MKYLFSILFCFFGLGLFSQNQALFDKANTLYNEGKFAEAIDSYSAILESGEHSAELYFNLANANYKLNNIAPSIYYYEKALLLAPNDADIKNNMAFAQNMTIDAIENVPDVGVSRFLKNLINELSYDNWAIVSIVLVFLFVILFLIYYFAYATVRKRVTFIGSLLTLFLVCVTVAFAFQKYNLDKRDNPAIVFVQETKVKSTPNAKSEEAFRLHEGTKVQVVETYNDWQKIKLTDGKTGWVTSEDIKMLKEF